jgi:hypothetical protein
MHESAQLDAASTGLIPHTATRIVLDGQTDAAA